MENKSRTQFLEHLERLLTSVGFSTIEKDKKWKLVQETHRPGRRIIVNSQTFREEDVHVKVSHSISIEGEGDVDGRQFMQVLYTVAVGPDEDSGTELDSLEECIYLDELQFLGYWVYQVLGIKIN